MTTSPRRSPSTERLLSAALLLLTLATALPTHAQDEGWWRADYIGDYSAIALSLGLAVGLQFIEPSESAALGPAFDPDHPETILDPLHRDLIGRRHLDHHDQTVPEADLIYFTAAGLATTMLIEGVPTVNGADDFQAQTFHDATIGHLEALTFTLAVTQIIKVSAGRLRPDFQDRVRRFYCAQTPPPPIDCTDVGPAIDEDTLRDGQRSFISGHASLSFANATYIALALGGRFVWGERDNAGTAGLALAILGQTTAIAYAGFTAASRIDDGRHHATDILTGALVGIGLASLAYWRHFDGAGLPRERVDTSAAGVGGGQPRTSGVAFGFAF